MPYHFSACGVGRSWSAVGRWFFARALAGSASITLRDHLSAQRLQRLLPRLRTTVTFDPAIWASVVYPVVAQPAPRGFIGLGVMNRAAFNACTAGSRFSDAAWIDLWLDLIEALQHDSRPVCLFTTGSPDDQQFASVLHAQASQRGWQQVQLIPQPLQVATLARTLRSCSVVIAARLHAAALSNAFGVSSIGLMWDEKVRAYYEETGRPEHCFALTSASVNDIARAAQELYGRPFADEDIEYLRQRALDSARAILSGG
ncbi:MAG TPA: polysaccharide pyruvyl transferase family protein [Levilinea sp.]|nr:polysaccharide pyruvyl transferase family protein [Levilinea sp.]